MGPINKCAKTTEANWNCPWQMEKQSLLSLKEDVHVTSLNHKARPMQKSCVTGF